MKGPVSMALEGRTARGLVLAFVAALLGGAGACDSGVCPPTGRGGAGGAATAGGADGVANGGDAGSSGVAGMGGTSGAGGASGDGCPPVGPFAMTGCPEVAGAPLGVASHPDEGENHLVICSATCYGTNPPSSGNHYPAWPAYKTYSAPVPWGFLVHGLEHGAIIISYNCPCGCADQVAAAQAWIDALPRDPYCSDRAYVVLVPDPTLDVHWAASAWTWTLRADTFDASAFQSFFSDHYQHGREIICGGGTDGSATGWCQ